MYSNELVKDILIQALDTLKEIDFPKKKQKMTLDSDGNIITINHEKTVPLTIYIL